MTYSKNGFLATGSGGGTSGPMPLAIARTPLASPSWSTTSTTFVDVPPVTLATITKKVADTPVVVQIDTSYYRNTSAGLVEWGVMVDGATDHLVAAMYDNEISSHRGISGSIQITGLPVGEHTFKLRVRVVSGGAIQQDTGDYAHLLVFEPIGGGGGGVDLATSDKGIWSSGAAYSPGQLVRRHNRLYQALLSSTGSDPATPSAVPVTGQNNSTSAYSSFNGITSQVFTTNAEMEISAIEVRSATDGDTVLNAGTRIGITDTLSGALGTILCSGLTEAEKTAGAVAKAPITTPYKLAAGQYRLFVEDNCGVSNGGWTLSGAVSAIGDVWYGAGYATQNAAWKMSFTFLGSAAQNWDEIVAMAELPMLGPAAGDLPSTYPNGVSYGFADNSGTTWPTWGFLLTMKNGSDVVQTLWGVTGDTQHKRRATVSGGDVWTAWAAF